MSGTNKRKGLLRGTEYGRILESITLTEHGPLPEIDMRILGEHHPGFEHPMLCVLRHIVALLHQFFRLVL
jgi:hypothetical protein